MPTVDIEHGQTTYASIHAEPLANGLFQSSGAWMVTPAAPVDEPREHLVARQRRVAVQLGREHLDPRRRRADADLGAPAETSPSRMPFAYGAPDAPVMPRKTFIA